MGQTSSIVRGLHHALQGMLMGMGRAQNHLYLGCRDVTGVDPADAPTLVMHLEHDPCSHVRRLAKDPLQYHDHEFHGRVVVIEQDHLIHGRWRQFF